VPQPLSLVVCKAHRATVARHVTEQHLRAIFRDLAERLNEDVFARNEISIDVANFSCDTSIIRRADVQALWPTPIS
jgi:hypothetical protein